MKLCQKFCTISSNTSTCTLKLGQCNEKITPFGRIVLTKNLIENLGIKENIDNYLPKPDSNAGKLSSIKVIPAL